MEASNLSATLLARSAAERFIADLICAKLERLAFVASETRLVPAITSAGRPVHVPRPTSAPLPGRRTNPRTNRFLAKRESKNCSNAVGGRHLNSPRNLKLPAGVALSGEMQIAGAKDGGRGGATFWKRSQAQFSVPKLPPAPPRRSAPPRRPVQERRGRFRAQNAQPKTKIIFSGTSYPLRRPTSAPTNFGRPSSSLRQGSENDKPLKVLRPASAASAGRHPNPKFQAWGKAVVAALIGEKVKTPAAELAATAPDQPGKHSSIRASNFFVPGSTAAVPSESLRDSATGGRSNFGANAEASIFGCCGSMPVNDFKQAAYIFNGLSTTTGLLSKAKFRDLARNTMCIQVQQRVARKRAQKIFNINNKWPIDQIDGELITFEHYLDWYRGNAFKPDLLLDTQECWLRKLSRKLNVPKHFVDELKHFFDTVAIGKPARIDEADFGKILNLIVHKSFKLKVGMDMELPASRIGYYWSVVLAEGKTMITFEEFLRLWLKHFSAEVEEDVSGHTIFGTSALENFYQNIRKIGPKHLDPPAFQWRTKPDADGAISQMMACSQEDHDSAESEQFDCAMSSSDGSASLELDIWG